MFSSQVFGKPGEAIVPLASVRTDSHSRKSESNIQKKKSQKNSFIKWLIAIRRCSGGQLSKDCLLLKIVSQIQSIQQNALCWHITLGQSGYFKWQKRSERLRDLKTFKQTKIVLHPNSHSHRPHRRRPPWLILDRQDRYSRGHMPPLLPLQLIPQNDLGGPVAYYTAS